MFLYNFLKLRISRVLTNLTNECMQLMKSFPPVANDDNHIAEFPRNKRSFIQHNYLSWIIQDKAYLL